MPSPTAVFLQFSPSLDVVCFHHRFGPPRRIFDPFDVVLEVVVGFVSVDEEPHHFPLRGPELRLQLLGHSPSLAAVENRRYHDGVEKLRIVF